MRSIYQRDFATKPLKDDTGGNCRPQDPSGCSALWEPGAGEATAPNELDIEAAYAAGAGSCRSCVCWGR